MEVSCERVDKAYKYTFTVRSITCNKCLMVGVLPPKPTVGAGVVYYCPNCGEPMGYEFTGERNDG